MQTNTHNLEKLDIAFWYYTGHGEGIPIGTSAYAVTKAIRTADALSRIVFGRYD